MKSIETRKTIALFLTLVFGILIVVGYVMGKDIPPTVTPIISMVIGYYFGKSTALDKPG
jgi:Na+/H+ antiporter NhaC